MGIIAPILALAFFSFFVVAILRMEGYMKSSMDHKYDAAVEYLGERDKGESFYSHAYLITITVKATGDVVKNRYNRYPDIYSNEKTWARGKARDMYIKHLSNGSSFKL